MDAGGENGGTETRSVTQSTAGASFGPVVMRQARLQARAIELEGNMDTPRGLEFGKHGTYLVQCCNGHKYQQNVTPQQLPPYKCGACGSNAVSVYQLVYEHYSYSR